MSSNKVRGRPFQPGESGNVLGRPVGARSQFSANFLRDLAASWSECGPDVLAKVAANDPSRYLAVCIPRDVSLSIEQRLPGGLSAQDLEVFQAIRQAIPDANDRPPGEVLNYVLEAIRAHSAKTIEGE
jgi:hypothetical protein